MLHAIVTEVRVPGADWFEEVRRYELAYDEQAMACDAPHTPLRLLESITEVGRNAETRPATTFDYGSMARSLSDTMSVQFPADVPDTQKLGWGNRRVGDGFGSYSTNEAQLIDIDGDARPDRLYSVGEGCGIQWQRNRAGEDGGVVFEDVPGTHPLPSIPQHAQSTTGVYNESSSEREDCSLTGQLSFYRDLDPDMPPCNKGHFLTYRFMDVDADGIPDLLTALTYDPKFYYNPLSGPGDTAPRRIWHRRLP